MRRIRRKRDRQARQLARMLVALDRACADARPAPVRRTRLSVAK
jgi:hypothetical protein